MERKTKKQKQNLMVALPMQPLENKSLHNQLHKKVFSCMYPDLSLTDLY